jgi:hypothetical protein
MPPEEQEKQEQPSGEVITASDLAASFKSGDYELPQAKPAPSAEQEEELSDEEFEKKWEDYEKGKGEIPDSKKSIKRLFDVNRKSVGELEKKFAAELSEQKKKFAAAELSTLGQKRINLVNAYEKWFADSPEKAEKDFATPAEYRSYIKQRDSEKEAFAQAFKQTEDAIANGQAAIEAEAAKAQPGANFQFKDQAEIDSFNSKVNAYKKLVPEFENIGDRWSELPVATLEAITASPFAPAILHMAVDGGLAKYPEREQLKAVFELEANIAANLNKNTPPAPPSNAPPASVLPPAPPKFKGKGTSPNSETVITAKELAKQMREGK